MHTFVLYVGLELIQSDKWVELIDNISPFPIILLNRSPSAVLFNDHFLSRTTHPAFPFYLLPPLQPDEAALAGLRNKQESPHWYAGQLRLISLAASVRAALQIHHFGLPIWLPFQHLSVTPGEVNFLFLDLGRHSNKMK